MDLRSKTCSFRKIFSGRGSKNCKSLEVGRGKGWVWLELNRYEYVREAGRGQQRRACGPFRVRSLWKVLQAYKVYCVFGEVRLKRTGQQGDQGGRLDGSHCSPCER